MFNKDLLHIKSLLLNAQLPDIAADAGAELREIHDGLCELRITLDAFAQGNFSIEINGVGEIFDKLRLLQNHIESIFIQMQLVEQGNFTQQYPITNSFSEAFNRMLSQLDSTFSTIKDEEKALEERESQFRYLAAHDPLTGALNRRAFMEQTLSTLKKAAVKKVPCGIIMMDIDFFKKFNDTYGHLAGDLALKHLVNVLSPTMRRDDFLARYGGEEFVLFFFDTDQKEDELIAERMRHKLEITLVELGDRAVPMTASFGVTTVYPNEDIDEAFVEQLIHKADIALYKAKNNGRNRVEICE